jgi:hypothetical protein
MSFKDIVKNKNISTLISLTTFPSAYIVDKVEDESLVEITMPKIIHFHQKYESIATICIF